MGALALWMSVRAVQRTRANRFNDKLAKLRRLVVELTNRVLDHKSEFDRLEKNATDDAIRRIEELLETRTRHVEDLHELLVQPPGGEKWDEQFLDDKIVEAKELLGEADRQWKDIKQIINGNR